MLVVGDVFGDIRVMVGLLVTLLSNIIMDVLLVMGGDLLVLGVMMFKLSIT